MQFNTTVRGNADSSTIASQLFRCASSIGANYHEANRAESRKDFVHKTAISEKEAAECLYWLSLLQDGNFGNPEQRQTLLRESNELLAIFTAIGRTTKRNAKSEIRNPKSEFQ